MVRRNPLLIVSALALVVCFAFGCGEDSEPTEGDTTQSSDGGFQECEPDEYFDLFLETCLPKNVDMMDAGNDTQAGDTNAPDTNTTPDVGPDTTETPDVQDEPVDPQCDKDNDGALAMECGGDDCDDNDFSRAPIRDETCDEVDNNCNEEVNDGIDCTFYAHTGDFLYEVDPFGKWARQIAEVPNLFDIDTHPDGTLYGITGSELFFFDAPRRRWIEIGEFPTIEQGTGLAIDAQGTAFITAADGVSTVDLVTAETTFIGNLGSNFFSSGDCVVNKANTLFMTSKANDQPDTLVLIDRETGRGQAVGQIRNGGTTFSKIFGLTAGWGNLYGLNLDGQLLTIDPNTGEATLLHTFPDFRWFGAASTPGR